MATAKVFTEQEWEELKNKARREMLYVDIRPYSHNILGLYMANMTDEQMRKFATELELGELGWEHLDTRGEISELDKGANKIAFQRRRLLMNCLDDEPSEEGESESESEIAPNDLLALKELCEIYGKDRLKHLLYKIENESE